MNVEKIRQDFPILSKQGKKPLVYFDNACTTLKPASVIEATLEYYQDFPFCDRGSYRLSKAVGDRCAEVRSKVARYINANHSSEIIFTKNATEGISLIVNSLDWKDSDIVVTSDKEHNSNFVPWLNLAKRGSISHTIARTDNEGQLDLEYLKSIFKQNKGKVKLVSIVYTSNLDGATFPIKEIASLAHANDALILVDATQAAPHQRIDVKFLNVDFLVFSAHKMLGPTGIGALYVKKENVEKLRPIALGGGTVGSVSYDDFELLFSPERYEAGIQNFAGIYGFGAALDYLNKIGWRVIEQQDKSINSALTNKLLDIPRLRLIGSNNSEKRSGIFSFYIEGADSHYIAQLLEASANIAVRSGQLCVHSWFSNKEVESVVRISSYFYNTVEEAELITKEITNIVRIL